MPQSVTLTEDQLAKLVSESVAKALAAKAQSPAKRLAESIRTLESRLERYDDLTETERSDVSADAWSVMALKMGWARPS